MSKTQTNHIKTEQQTHKIKTKSTGKRYRFMLTCVICDGNAHGYNFDAISCESCKAFFRRNALRSAGELKCHGNGICNVSFDQKRRCKKCRLEKCFRAGMRKEWILTDKEKEEKRIKIEENRRLKLIRANEREDRQHIKREPQSYDDLSKDFKNKPLFISQVYLTETDWLKIRFVQNAYIEAVKLNQTAGISQYPSIQPITSTLGLFCVPIYISSMRLITYFKQIPEFQQLDKNEQVYVVKLNTLTLAFLHSIYIYDYEKEVYHEKNTSDPLFLEKDWINTITKEFHYEMKQIQNDLLEIIQLDETIIKIFFLIILFSNNFTLKDQTININTLSIFKAQNIYNELFYKYSLHHYNLYKSTKLFIKYINNIMKIQKLINELKYTIGDYMNITQLSPLMQSLF